MVRSCGGDIDDHRCHRRQHCVRVEHVAKQDDGNARRRRARLLEWRRDNVSGAVLRRRGATKSVHAGIRRALVHRHVGVLVRRVSFRRRELRP